MVGTSCGHMYIDRSFEPCTSLETYGAEVTQLKAPVGGVATFPQIEEALKAQKYKIITVIQGDVSLAGSTSNSFCRSLKWTHLQVYFLTYRALQQRSRRFHQIRLLSVRPLIPGVTTISDLVS
jgi:hypothetical protein